MSDVSTKSKSVMAMEAEWDLARDLLGGTPTMRAAGKRHLPQWENETDQAYSRRLSTAVLFPAYERTVETLAAKPFSKPVTLGKDIPEQIREWLDDVDLQGRNIDMFAADCMEAAMGLGIGGILVDCPDTSSLERTADGIVTLATEKAAGLRPYFVQIHAHQFRGARARCENGKWTLTQFRFLEVVEEDDGDFNTKEVEQIRVLEPGKWSTWRQDSKTKEWVQYQEGATTLAKVPFVPFYGKRIAFMVGKPPLAKVAYLNVQHWQESSDQQKSVKFARVRMAAITGAENVKDDEITIGADYFIKLPTGCDLKVVQGSAESVKVGREELDTLEEQIRQAGGELLVIKPGPVTATQTNSENAVGMCVLQRITLGLEDALDQALQIKAEWVNLPTGGHVTLFNDFGVASLAEASMQVVTGMKLSDETKFEEAQRRGIISADRKWKDEKARIDAQGSDPGANIVQ